MSKAIGAAIKMVVPVSLALAPAFARAQAAPFHRTPAERQTVIQLAYAMGEAHALHRVCAGTADATWYVRMQRLEAQEASDDSFRRRLVDSFNSGFASRQAEFPACGPASQRAERRVAAHGGALARRLAGGGAE